MSRLLPPQTGSANPGWATGAGGGSPMRPPWPPLPTVRRRHRLRPGPRRVAARLLTDCPMYQHIIFHKYLNYLYSDLPVRPSPIYNYSLWDMIPESLGLLGLVSCLRSLLGESRLGPSRGALGSLWGAPGAAWAALLPPLDSEVDGSGVRPTPERHRTTTNNNNNSSSNNNNSNTNTQTKHKQHRQRHNKTQQHKTIQKKHLDFLDPRPANPRINFPDLQAL